MRLSLWGMVCEVYGRLVLREPPPKPVVFFNERFTTARHEEWCENVTFIYLLVCKGLSNDDRRDGKGHRNSRDTVGSWSQNPRFHQRNVGGATVERLGSGRGEDGRTKENWQKKSECSKGASKSNRKIAVELLLNRTLTLPGTPPCKLEVWEWVVKRRIFNPFSKFSGLI